MYFKTTSLNNPDTHNTFDSAIGGTAALLRLYQDDHPEAGFQMDFFATVFTRIADYNTVTAIDYRFGVPITFGSGPWEAKLPSYEHTSTHLGDDFIRVTGRVKEGHVRDELVCGLAYRFWDQLRAYGQFGYALSLTSAAGNRRDRYDFGLEWSKQHSTGFHGQPFAAVDVELCGDEDYHPNVTAQIGWQWLEPGARLPSLRLGLELYDGRSPFGQFFRQNERWAGIGIYLDF
jgi:hypothetical protein